MESSYFNINVKYIILNINIYKGEEFIQFIFNMDIQKQVHKEIQKEVKDTNRFFFPDEWKKFISSINKSKFKNKFLYELQFNTGARFDELTHIRPSDFDFDRNNIRIWKTKTKAKKGEKVGKPRTISLSSIFVKRIKKFSQDKKTDEFLFKISQAGYNQLLKRKLQELGIKDWKAFSSHNIRKTHGMYLKALGIGIEEICPRLGHDYNTYLAHYGSADVFSEKDMRAIRELLDDLYFRRRNY